MTTDRTTNKTTADDLTEEDGACRWRVLPAHLCLDPDPRPSMVRCTIRTTSSALARTLLSSSAASWR
jgi:hypothetical protein